MKNKILILSPLLLTFFIYFASCCKEDICVNKLAGKYKCDVSGYSYSSSEPDIPLANSTIIEEVSIVDDSTLLLKVTIGDTPELYDTINLIANTMTNDSIYFDNYDHIVHSVAPTRSLRGYFTKNKLFFRVSLYYTPTQINRFDYYGKKKII